MAQQDDDQERDLPATEQKIRKAREEGNVPRSRELAGGVVLISGVGLLYVTGEALVAQSELLMKNGLILDRAQAFDTKYMGLEWVSMMMDSLLILVPLFCVVFVAAVVANLGVGGMNWSTKPSGTFIFISCCRLRKNDYINTTKINASNRRNIRGFRRF